MGGRSCDLGAVEHLMPIDPEELVRWVQRSCADQGVPVTVTDAAVVARIGVLMSGSATAGRPPQGATAGALRS